MVTVATPCQVVYRHAQPGATLTDISGTWSPPAASVRLQESRNVAITSYNGTHGTIRGPWPTGMPIATGIPRRWPTDMYLAVPVITVRVTPLTTSNSCRTFSVLVKGTS